jgi:hypothetical protein
MRDDTQWLLDIIEAIERIERYSSRGRDAFERDELVQNWIVHHLQVIGEAARSLSSDLREEKQRYPLGKNHRDATHSGSSLFRDRPGFGLVGGCGGSARVEAKS